MEYKHKYKISYEIVFVHVLLQSVVTYKVNWNWMQLITQEVDNLRTSGGATPEREK